MSPFVSRLAAPSFGFLLSVAGSPATACFVCIDLPQDTQTDRVWAAETVAIARNDPADPFVYRVVETLAGGTDAPIRLLVAATERRVMETDPQRVALLLHGPDGWRIGGHGGDEYVRMVRAILDHEVQWSDATDDPDRLAAFAALHAHEDPAIRRLALTELARAPYAELRKVAVGLDADWLMARLADASWYAWRPLLVQLLGLHPDPSAHALVRARALDVPEDVRAPWLVALIEMDGAAGIDAILAAHPEGAAARAATLALVAHADPAHELAHAILAALRQVAASDPAALAAAVPGLMALGDTSLAPRVVQLLAGRQVRDPAEAFALKSYLAHARSEKRREVARAGED